MHLCSHLGPLSAFRWCRSGRTNWKIPYSPKTARRSSLWSLENFRRSSLILPKKKQEGLWTEPGEGKRETGKTRGLWSEPGEEKTEYGGENRRTREKRDTEGKSLKWKNKYASENWLCREVNEQINQNSIRIPKYKNIQKILSAYIRENGEVKKIWESFIRNL